MTTTTSYDTAKARAIAILDERLAGTTMVALLRWTNAPRRYRIVTNQGGGQIGIRTESSAFYHFDAWVKALEAEG